MRDLTKAILPSGGKPLQLAPCTITQVSPLLVLMNNGATYTCQRVPGLTYTVGGNAIAIWSDPNTPVILPIGA